MTLLTIIQDAALECDMEPPATVIGNTADIIAQKMLRAAQRTGLDLVKRSFWGELRNVATFTATATEVQANVVPADFDRMIPETFWDRTNRRLISGPVVAARWQSLVATQQPGTDARWFTLRGGNVLIYPTMQGGESMAFEYASKNFCQSTGGVAQARWTADSDTGRLSEELFTLGVIANFQKAEGLPWADSYREYEARIETEVSADQPRVAILSAGDLFGGRRAWGGAPAGDFTFGGYAGTGGTVDDLSGGGLT